MFAAFSLSVSKRLNHKVKTRSGSWNLITTLNLAIESKEYTELLLLLLPNQQDENKLRLVYTIMEYQTCTFKSCRQLKANELLTNFLQPESPFEVVGIPSHLRKLPFDTMVDLINFMLLKHLIKIPEVAASLSPSDSAPVFETNSRRRSTVLKRTSSNRGSYFSGPQDELSLVSFEHCNGNLSTMGQLEHIISNLETRRVLLENLITSTGGLLVRIRFVSAVDQLIGSTSEKEKRTRIKKIQDIFREGGMFEIPCVTKLIKQGKLEEARVEVLKQLSVNHQITKALGEMDSEEEVAKN